MAVHRMDHDAAVIQEAALLHDFAEMLLWCHAPAPALEIARRQQADPALRSAQAQRDVLGIELPDLQHTLMQAWHLPQLLIQLGDDRHADSGPVKNVLLAVQLARHTASGWDNPSVPDDVAAIAELLRQTPESTLELLRDLDT
jgi:HD-like signal output (HDOD) protein